MIFHDVLLATATTISMVKITSGMWHFNYALVGMGTTGECDLSNFGMHLAGFCHTNWGRFGRAKNWPDFAMFAQQEEVTV